MSKPRLRIVDSEGQLVGEDCPHCRDTELALRVERGKNTRLKNELAQAMAVEPIHEQIVEVLSFWRRTLAPNASIVEGSDNWKAVRARLREKDAETHEQRFDVLRLKAAVVGISLSEWHMAKGQSHRRHPATAFGNAGKVDRLIEGAVAFKRQTGSSALTLLDELGSGVLWWLAERCGCGHVRAQHAVQGPTQDLRLPCDVEGCGCTDMDWFEAKWQRAVQEREGQ